MINSCPSNSEFVLKISPEIGAKFQVTLNWPAEVAEAVVSARAVMGTHFATRVPAYQYPAGTRLLGVECSQL